MKINWRAILELIWFCSPLVVYLFWVNETTNNWEKRLSDEKEKSARWEETAKQWKENAKQWKENYESALELADLRRTQINLLEGICEVKQK